MSRPNSAPAADTGDVLLLTDIAAAAREESYRYWERRAEWPEVLVLAGPRAWQRIRVAVGREGQPWWRLDVATNEIVAPDGRARIVRADIGPDEWRVALLTDRRGSI